MLRKSIVTWGNFPGKNFSVLYQKLKHLFSKVSHFPSNPAYSSNNNNSNKSKWLLFQRVKRWKELLFILKTLKNPQKLFMLLKFSFTLSFRCIIQLWGRETFCDCFLSRLCTLFMRLNRLSYISWVVKVVIVQSKVVKCFQHKKRIMILLCVCVYVCVCLVLLQQ